MVGPFSWVWKLRQASPVSFAPFVALVLLASAGSADAMDIQNIERGKGLRDTLCVDSGIDGIRDSVAAGDDTLVGIAGQEDIQSGANGICESTPNSLNAGGDDVHPSGITLGQGESFRAIIRPQPDNICRSVVNLKNDDQLRVSGPGTSTPQQVGVRADPDATIESSPAGDDVITALICPDADSTLESSTSGDDVFLAGTGTRCSICPFGATACISPGADDVLDSTAAVTDEEREYVSTGANGISETSAAASDILIIPLTEGAPFTICVDSGADGIADTLLCGNGVVDIDENGITGDTECEDGNEINEDGCSDICQPEVCGDSITQGGLGETCDDGNSDDDDPCVGCQTAVCGDGFTCSDGSCTSGPGGGPEECDDGGTTPGDGCDGTCGGEPFCGNGETDPGEQCDDGNNDSNDGCDAVCMIEFCGDAIIQSGIGETCEDGNADNADTCVNCQAAACGDGFTCSAAGCISGPGAGPEECDDGDAQNNDDCVLGCALAFCGDGFVKKKDTPPFEECDDGNNVNGDGCSATCVDESNELCGNGILDDHCTAGLVGLGCAQNSDCDTGPPDGLCEPEDCDDGNSSDKDDCTNQCSIAACGDGVVKTKGTPPFEECDDANTSPGDGCSGTCDAECGNGQIDGGCSQGLVGLLCQNNSDCDTGPPDGVCVTEACDWAISGLCFPGPNTCSNVCLIAACGNDEVECDEQCDLGVNNGVSGSGCTALCKRNLIGKRELKGKRECSGAWTLDSPPEDVGRKTQRCVDGAACDFDAVAGQCTFRVGVCLNRPLPLSCTAGKISAVDLIKLDVEDPVEAAAAQAITTAIEGLTGGGVDTPDRCREGVRSKNCSIPDDDECDTFLGAGNGKCDIGTGVVFTPPLDPAILLGDQITTCTPGTDVVVPAGGKLKLRTLIRRSEDGLRKDKDRLRLICRD